MNIKNKFILFTKMSHLMLLVFGTNQNYEPPFDLIKKFLSSKQANILESDDIKKKTNNI